VGRNINNNVCPLFSRYRLYVTANGGATYATDGDYGKQVLYLMNDDGAINVDCVASGTYASGACNNSYCGACSASACDLAQGCVDVAFEGKTAEMSMSTAVWTTYTSGSHVPAWIAVDFEINNVMPRGPVRVSGYKVESGYPITAFVAWKFEGSNDGVSWTTLDTQSDQDTSKKLKTYNLECATDPPMSIVLPPQDSGVVSHSFVADGANTKIYFAEALSCNTFGCSTTFTTSNTSLPCPPGSTIANDLCWVFMCPAGQYHLSPTQCQNMTNTTCPTGIGYHSPSARSSSTIEGSTSNDSSCTPCIPGQYKNTPSPTACLSCPIGYYTDVSSSSLCKSCPKGFYSTAPAKSTCDACQAGTYNDQTASTTPTACTVCAPGAYQNASGSEECKLCPTGKKLVTAETAEYHNEFSDCEECDVFQFNPYEGHAEDCYMCLTAIKTGSIQCDGCDPGTCLVVVVIVVVVEMMVLLLLLKLSDSWFL
jgi:hypothetical protein